MKNIIYISFLLLASFVFSQNDTIKDFNDPVYFKIIYPSVRKSFDVINSEEHRNDVINKINELKNKTDNKELLDFLDLEIKRINLAQLNINNYVNYEMKLEKIDKKFLKKFNIVIDEFSKQISIVPKNKLPNYLYIVISDNILILRFKTSYFGENWIFYDGIKLLSNNEIVELIIENKNDIINSSGTVSERSDTFINNQTLEFFRNSIKNGYFKLRFEGENSYYDFNSNDYTNKMKGITDVIELYDLLSN